MTKPTPIGHLNFIAICQRLLEAVTSAESDDAREAAEAEFSHFLRMSGAGRLQQWAESHPELVVSE
jgi:hypothetical protein